MYKIEGKNIVSEKTGNVVAVAVGEPGTVIDIVCNKGNMMKHKKNLEKWLKDQGINYGKIRAENLKDEEQTAEAPAPASEPVQEEKSVQKAKETKASDIPWPPWSDRLGFETPGFKEWIEEHKLSSEQVATIVLRLEKNEHLKEGARI